MYIVEVSLIGDENHNIRGEKQPPHVIDKQIEYTSTLAGIGHTNFGCDMHFNRTTPIPIR